MYDSLVAKSVSNTAGMVSEINTILQTMGWTLHDDQSGASPPHYVYYSDGETQGARVYLRVKWSDTADRVDFTQYLHWNNSTHSGFSYQGTSQVQVVADDDGSFNLWVYGDKDMVLVITKIGASYSYFGLLNALPFYNQFGIMQNSVSSGSNVVLTLDAGQPANFDIGRTYKVVGTGEGEGAEDVTVTAKSGNTITVGSLTRGISANSVIGIWPWRWIMVNWRWVAYLMTPSFTGTGNSSSSSNGSAEQLFEGMAPGIDNFYQLAPNIVKYSGDNLGYTNKHFCLIYLGNTSEHTLSVDNIDSGTATSGGATTLTDTAKSWSDMTDKCLIIKAGAGAGQIRKITSNTATVLTVPAWTITPDSTSEYVICEHGYRYFRPNTSYRYFAVREV